MSLLGGSRNGLGFYQVAIRLVCFATRRQGGRVKVPVAFDFETWRVPVWQILAAPNRAKEPFHRSFVGFVAKPVSANTVPSLLEVKSHSSIEIGNVWLPSLERAAIRATFAATRAAFAAYDTA